jgi:protein-tyrosine-phosphatase
MRTFIFACIHNAGRSQMSAAFFNQFVDPDLARGISAGTHPAERVHPVVVDAMREVGIDLSNAKPQKRTAELAQDAEMLVTMGAETNAPTFPVSGAMTGPCQTQRDKGSNRYGRPAMRSSDVFWIC